MKDDVTTDPTSVRILRPQTEVAHARNIAHLVE